MAETPVFTADVHAEIRESEEINKEEFLPSDFGVSEIDTKQNKAIADQIKKNIKDEEQLFREYKKHRSEVFKKYKSIKQLKKQALEAAKDPYGQNSQALNDYQTLVAYENLLNQAKYVENNYKPAVLYQSANDKKIDESKLYDNLPQDLKEAVDYIFNGEPVYNVVGNEFPNNGENFVDRVTEYYKKNYNSKINIKNFGEVLLDKKSVKNSSHHYFNENKINAFVAVPYILQQGKIANLQEQYKGKNEDRILFVAPITIKNEEYFCEVVVKATDKYAASGVKRFYLHEVELTKKLADVFQTSLGGTSASSKSIIADLVNKLNPNTLNQLVGYPKEPQRRRDVYYASEKAIELFKDADYSTLPHEFAHFWLDNMWSYTRSSSASEAYKNNFKAVLDFLGVKDYQIYFTRRQHEKFAKAYEKYLFEGYAPNGLVVGAFEDYDKKIRNLF